MSLLLFLLSFHFSVLDKVPVYQNPIAYNRSPQSGMTFFFAKEDSKQKANYLEGTIGKSFALATLSYKRQYYFQLGIEASTWATLGKKGDFFPLVTQDFLMSIPIYYRMGNISGAVKYNHISAHLSDGSYLVSKYMQPITYSRDFLSYDIAYDIFDKYMISKVYASTSYATKMYPKDLKRLSLGAGFETQYNATFWVPYLAYDLRYNQDTNSFDNGLQLGVQLANETKTIFDTRLALTGYFGSDRRGQFLGHKVEQIGLALIVR